MLIWRILEAPCSTPVEALYLELGLLPINYILKGRRLMFLHYVLNLDEEEMLSQFFWAQWKSPVTSDWTETIKKDLKILQIDKTLHQIKIMKKETFAKLVKESCRHVAFNELIDMKNSHSKMTNILYSSLKLQPYLKDKKIRPDLAKTLFKFRTRMVNFRNNFKKGSPFLSCPLGDNKLDDQQHLLNCDKLQPTINSDLNYYDIFSNDIDKMSATINILKQKFEKREKLLENEK